MKLNELKFLKKNKIKKICEPMNLFLINIANIEYHCRILYKKKGSITDFTIPFARALQHISGRAPQSYLNDF